LLADGLCDEVVARGRAAGTVEVDDGRVDLAVAVDVLEGWDRRYELDSTGAVLWREFLGGFSDADLRDAGALFADGFDAADFLSHPCTLAEPGDIDQIAVALARAVLALDEAGLTPDCRLGDVQFVERSGQRFGLHGGGEVEGVTNVVMAFGGLARDDLEPPEYTYLPAAGRDLRTGLHQGGYPVLYGVSFLMVAEFTDDGPDARGLLVYGQSGDRRSVHHVDQIEAFAEKRLRPLLFRDTEIDAATIERRTLRGHA
jgi:acyl-homoserine-lactone acylase